VIAGAPLQCATVVHQFPFVLDRRVEPQPVALIALAVDSRRTFWRCDLFAGSVDAARAPVLHLESDPQESSRNDEFRNSTKIATNLEMIFEANVGSESGITNHC
jgi:hypothetical protein